MTISKRPTAMHAATGSDAAPGGRVGPQAMPETAAIPLRPSGIVRRRGGSSCRPHVRRRAFPLCELLEQLLGKMGIAGAHVRYYARTEGEYLEIDGPDLANLIGRHGHTLEALNLIFNNMVNAGVKKDRHYFTIDAEGYRARRADLLKGLALQMLERALREKRAISLEPMLPSERKVIHLALADNPFVTTESSGVEPERRVVVIPRPA
jgi:spoIIIJ-associated protein